MFSDPAHLFLLIFFFLGMLAFALLINRVLLRFVTTLGTKNQPGALKRWSAETKPAIGGLGFFIVFLISFWVYSILFDPNQVFGNTPILGLLIAATMAFVMGLTDDAYNTRPVLKFSVQVMCGVILVISDTQIQIFENPVIDQILTVLWVIGMMNSINMLDNMDGIAGSVSAFIILAGISNLIISGRSFEVDMILLLAVLAAICGFLYYNWHPSKIYMGDTGSQFLGVILAYVGIKYCWNLNPLGADASPLTGVSAVLLVFLLPIIDTTVVTINRMRLGQSPFIGGRDHTTHNLSYFGISDGKIGWIFTIKACIMFALYSLMVLFGAGHILTICVLSAIYFLTVLLLMMGITVYNARRTDSRSWYGSSSRADS